MSQRVTTQPKSGRRHIIHIHPAPLGLVKTYSSCSFTVSDKGFGKAKNVVVYRKVQLKSSCFVNESAQTKHLMQKELYQSRYSHAPVNTPTSSFTTSGFLLNDVFYQFVVCKLRTILCSRSTSMLVLQRFVSHGIDVSSLRFPELGIVTWSEAQGRHEPVSPVKCDANHQAKIVEPFAGNVRMHLLKSGQYLQITGSLAQKRARKLIRIALKSTATILMESSSLKSLETPNPEKP